MTDVPTKVPVQFLRWLRPGDVYNPENIFLDSKQFNFVETKVVKNEKESFARAQKFGRYPSFESIAEFLKIDPELAARFLLTSSPDVRQFFNFDRSTVLIYVCYVDKKLTTVPNKNGCVNNFQTGYSYLATLNSRFVSAKRNGSFSYQYDLVEIRRVLEQKNVTDEILEHCEILLNWTPATIEQLQDYIAKKESGYLFYELVNFKKLGTKYGKLLQRMNEIELDTVKQFAQDQLITKAWELATKLISSAPHIHHPELLDCFWYYRGPADFYAEVCQLFGDIYLQEIAAIDAEKLFNDVLNLRPIELDIKKQNSGPKPSVPKTVIHIPSGSSAFWQKVFDGDDVVIKQDEKSTVRVTTKTGKQFTVQVIQPYQFSGISVFNKTDAQLEKYGVRFVCQFCRTFLNVHSEKEGIVYCRCGTFKNSNFIPADHKFESHKPKIPADEMNILLIGAVMAGKSTLINNIANLVKFKTQKEAYNGELTAVIPSRFVVGKSRDNLDVETIVVGQDLPEAENEDFNDFGQSVTQRPRMCSITAELPSGETKKFNIIDTPGINDTRGLDQDDINIDHIKRAVLQAGYLHAICIVLLPNQSRMEADFETVLRRLLQFVPLEHRPNLVLFFTNTRGTLYRPGQTYPVLRKFAETEPVLQIPLDQDRLFCFDSESYNFLCAHHHGIEYDLTSPSHYKDSWKESRKSLYRFFEFLDTVTPFATSEIGFIDTADTLFIKCTKALKKLSVTNTQYDTVKHLIGVLASSFNGEVKKARIIAQSIGFTEDIKLQRIQQLAFFRQLTRIGGLLSDTLQEMVQNFCDLYEPHFRFNNELVIL